MSELFYSSAPLEVVRSDAKECEVSFSSDTPIEHGEMGRLSLKHSPEAVMLQRLNSGVGAVLLEHNRYEQIGSVVRAWVDTVGRKCKAIIRFGASDTARQVWADVASGTRRGISVGFRIHERKQQGADLWIATRWEPLELSLVSIPADINVGIGVRSFNSNSKHKNMSKKKEYSAAEVAELMDLERDFGIDSREIMNRGLSVDEAQKEALRLASEAARRNRKNADAARGAARSVPIMKNGEIVHNGVDSRGDFGDYNLLRAIRSASTGEPCHERDISRDLARRSGRDPSGVLVPMEVLGRAVTVGDGSGGAGDGATLVPVDQGGFIDALRPRLAVARLGSTVLAGLKGDLNLPRQVAASSVGWKGETAELDEAKPEFDSLTLRPKRVGAFAVFSKQLLAQSDPSVQRLVSSDLLSALAVAIDKAAIQGTGANDEPTGLLYDTDVAVHELGNDGGALDYGELVEIVRDLADADADDGSLAFLTNPAVRAALQSAIYDSGSGLSTWEKAQLLGRWAISTNVPSNLEKGEGEDLSALVYGDFSQLILASWGDSVDLIIDPYSLATSGETRVILNAFCDIGIRRPEKFIRVTDIDTSGS